MHHLGWVGLVWNWSHLPIWTLNIDLNSPLVYRIIWSNHVDLWEPRNKSSFLLQPPRFPVLHSNPNSLEHGAAIPTSGGRSGGKWCSCESVPGFFQNTHFRLNHNHKLESQSQSASDNLNFSAIFISNFLGCSFGKRKVTIKVTQSNLRGVKGNQSGFSWM